MDRTYTADGFDKAFIGYVERHNCPLLAVYDKEKCFDILMEDGEMTSSEAIEYFEYNVQGAYVGPGTPIYLEKCNIEYFRTLCDDN